MRVAMLQMNSRHDKAANIAAIREMFETRIKGQGVDLVVAPEYATFLGGSKEEQWAAGESFPEGEGYGAMRQLAIDYGVTFHVGSMIETEGNNHYNTAVVFDPEGNELARYRKIHLFDVETPQGHVFRESDIINPGSEIVSYEAGPLKVGCAICYDMRFAELFQTHMKNGCTALTVPAAFNMETGKDHWEPILRARAIENQCWLIAPGQVGLHKEPAGERACYGNSMIIDPWGTVIARASNRPGVTIADLDMDLQENIRTILPSNKHHVLG
ncbi:MAG: carbon-nitrogen hydrolase family protein [Rhodobacteraceae bacterium]|nr:carbon-nitrogen hydrolase family protein [Paracoccaceae bacterium]MBR9822298.1 carbon-nitrogen hydrolase family protein [Paracoccaceae bacterium]